jgi:hypothetical protein
MIPMAQALPGGGGIGPRVARAAGAQFWGSAFVKTSASVKTSADKTAGKVRLRQGFRRRAGRYGGTSRRTGNTGTRSGKTCADKKSVKSLAVQTV